MRLELSGFVERDLDAIAEYIAHDAPIRAVSFLREIREKFRRIQHDPLLYQLRPEIGEGARLAMIGNYAILFRTQGNVVRVERVVYGNRDLTVHPENW